MATYRRDRLTISKFIMTVILGAMCLCIIIPLLYIISVSLTSDIDLGEYGYRLIPKHFTGEAYKYIFKSPQEILNAYGVTIFVTVVGTFLSLTVTSMLAYTLSRKDYCYRKVSSFLVFFTVLFNGGLVPWYILISQYLKLKDNIFVLILPAMVSAWFVLLMKGFMQSLPVEIFESAKVDGASEFRVFFRIVMPLSKPGLATVGLFIALMYWNDWWLALLFIDNNRLVPLQLMLNKIMSNISFLLSNLAKNIKIDMTKLPTESARMAMCALAAGPMLFVFPFFQKYFIRGLTVGSVKG